MKLTQVSGHPVISYYPASHFYLAKQLIMGPPSACIECEPYKDVEQEALEQGVL